MSYYEVRLNIYHAYWTNAIIQLYMLHNFQYTTILVIFNELIGKIE